MFTADVYWYISLIALSYIFYRATLC